jgi:carboxyl-terminal processing protease
LGRWWPTVSASRAAGLAAIAILLAALAARAEEAPIVEVETLRPSLEHRRTTAVVVDLMQRHHYRRLPIDDTLSERMFERYLKALDGQRVFFLASDIAEFEPLGHELDDALRKASPESAFDLFKRFRERVSERAAYARELLSTGFDFARDEDYLVRREDAPWAATRAALDEIWRKRVKNDVLALRLAGRTEAEITDTLRKRYERMERRVAQLAANDVYAFFVNAYTTSVDPHSAYFSPRASENFKIQMSLSLEGIGAALQTEDEFTVVRRIIAGGPAALSKQLHVDDRIVGVGQGQQEEIVDVVSWRLADVVDLIRGPKGSVVRLQTLPGDVPPGSPPKTISLVRDKINLEEQAAKRSLTEVEIDGRALRIGAIDLPTFYLDTAGRAKGIADYRSTTRDVRRLLAELAGEGVDGIIVDLRGNSGGSLVEATDLTGLFIERGPVVQIKDSRGRVEITQDTDSSVVYAGPLAVLVDRGSASASEIFAAAIQDYGRGVVLGEPTYGKGTVQSVSHLDSQRRLGQLKFTIAQFFRINGEGTQHRGVRPDILFPTASDTERQGERSLDNALPWESVAPADYAPWAPSASLYDAARIRHQQRVRDDELFATLLEELAAQRQMREQKVASLLETERTRQWQKRRDEREARETLYRKAFGIDVEAEEGEAVPDVILEEAARVLGDLIVLRRPKGA